MLFSKSTLAKAIIAGEQLNARPSFGDMGAKSSLTDGTIVGEKTNDGHSLINIGIPKTFVQKLSLKSIGPLCSLIMGGEIKRIDEDENFIQPKFSDAENLNGPFAPHYEQAIRPHVRKFDESRVKVLEKVQDNGFKALVGIVLLLFLYFTFVVGTEAADFVGMMLLMIIGLICGYVAWPVFSFKGQVKAEIFPNVFEYFGDDFSYNAFGNLDVRSLKPFGILPYFTGSNTEDHIQGRYQNVELEIIEAALTTRSSDGKSRSRVFNGMFILFSMNKDFAGQTIIKTDRGKIGNFFSGTASHLDRVTLEDPIFEDQFEVYSSDQVEARYLLSTSFMERLSSLAGKIGEKKIQASFYENKLLLAIPSTVDRFETASIFEPASFVEDINGILAEMSMIFGIVDTLKLDEKTKL